MLADRPAASGLSARSGFVANGRQESGGGGRAGEDAWPGRNRPVGRSADGSWLVAGGDSGQTAENPARPSAGGKSFNRKGAEGAKRARE